MVFFLPFSQTPNPKPRGALDQNRVIEGLQRPQGKSFSNGNYSASTSDSSFKVLLFLAHVLKPKPLGPKPFNPKPYMTHYSSFHFLFHYPNITPIFVKEFEPLSPRSSLGPLVGSVKTDGGELRPGWSSVRKL